MNPGIRYVQGMNEILAPLFYVFKNDPDEENVVSNWVYILASSPPPSSLFLFKFENVLLLTEGIGTKYVAICVKYSFSMYIKENENLWNDQDDHGNDDRPFVSKKSCSDSSDWLM